MILHTGGFAVGAIFTRSSPASWACFSASLAEIIPNCSPFSPINRISRSLICSLIIKSLIVVHLHHIQNSSPAAFFAFLSESDQKKCRQSDYPHYKIPQNKLRKIVLTTSRPFALRWERILFFLFHTRILYHTLFILSSNSFCLSLKTIFSFCTTIKCWRIPSFLLL